MVERLQLADCVKMGASINELTARLSELPADLLGLPDDDPIWMTLPREVDCVLEELGDVEEALWVAIMVNRADAIALLAPVYADPNLRHEDTTPAVVRAAEHDLPEALDALLAAGADVSAVVTSPIRGREGRTALHVAASPRIVAQLLAAGAQLEAIDKEYKHTPLVNFAAPQTLCCCNNSSQRPSKHRAAKDGRLEVVEALLAAGANPLARSRPRLLIDDPLSNTNHGHDDLFAEIGPPSTPRDLALAEGHAALAGLLARAEKAVGAIGSTDDDTVGT